MIYLLHLETATKVCSAALSLNGKLVQLEESLDEQFNHGEKLTLYIEEILRREHITAKQLSGVSISSGPGSYTGLRIGTSAAKGLCYGLNIPLLAIDTLEAMVEGAIEHYPAATIIPMIDARRMEVFCRIFKDKKFGEISAEVLDKHSFEMLDPFVAIGDSNHKLKSLWEGRNIIFRDDLQASAKNQVRRVFEKFTNKEFEDLAYFEPFYLKDFQAK